MESPFITHRDKVLGHYGTASWLRKLVLAMWNGSAYPVGLSQLPSLDREHREAAMAMVSSYCSNGERDQAFMALANECRTRLEEEQAAAERSERFEEWRKDAQFAIRQAGGRSYFVEDHYAWFCKQFEAGIAPESAAELALKSNLDAPQ